MAAHSYPELLALVEAGRLRPDLLVRRHVGLDQAGAALAAVGAAAGITVVTP
jgi:alcohol dehydrogenase